jgi:nucleoside-diphosphate kinase
MERTLAIIKPDAVHDKHIGAIIDRIEKEGFTLLGMKQVHLTKKQAEDFYAVHKGKPFLAELVDYMASGPAVVMALAKTNAIQSWRDVMGATDPAKAAPGTLRKLYGTHIGRNVTHGSDAAQTAAFEIKFFFPELA